MIRVAVVEDHPIFRDGICRAIEAAADLQLVAAHGSVEGFEASPEPVDVVVLDLNLPGASGAEGVRRIRTFAPALIVSAASTRNDVLDAIAAGASGYLTKDASAADIVAAIGFVAGGGCYVSPTLAGYLLEDRTVKTQDDTNKLSSREREILTLVASGERDTDIAEMLFISVSTVRSHLDRIRDKTGQRRRPDLTRFAIEQGFTEGNDQQPRR